ncbi:MAG: hypothetical protein EA381_19795 [Planctomycetaceae bacterium]|nr:MAG: hypothetical protein EA381_19795 [Planctomycetaceae bacterium]
MRTRMTSKLLSPESTAPEFEQNPYGDRTPVVGSLWLLLFGGAICWTIHLLFVVAVSEWGCFSGMGEFRFLGATAIAWSVIVASLIAATVAGWVMFLSLRSNWRQCGSDSGSDGEDFDKERGSGCYLAQVAVWSNGLFLFIIVAQTIPILFYLSEC